MVALSRSDPCRYSWWVLALEPMGAHPICKGSGPAGQHAAWEGPHQGVGVEVADQGGGYSVIWLMLKDMVEVVSSHGSSMVDVDNLEGDRSVVQYIDNQSIEGCHGVRGDVPDCGCY